MPADQTEVQIISDEVGFHTAVVMCEIWGGKTLYIPNTPSATHPISHDIGLQKLAQLCEIFGGQIIHLPKLDYVRVSKRRRIACELTEMGMSRKDIAQTLDVTTARVGQWLSEC